MKILLFGSSGLLGSALFSELHKQHRLIAPTRTELDILDVDAVNHAVKTVEPEIIINATGYTNVDGAEQDSAAAYALNEQAVRIMANASAKKIPIMHFSTDYVFDGKKQEGYTENDAPHPLSLYGKSKLAGERSLQESTELYYIIRTSWLYGPKRKNFVDTMLHLAADEKPLTVVNDQYGSPTYSHDLAQKVGEMISALPQYGIYHLTNSGTTTWYDFAKEIFYQLGIPAKITPITTEQLGRPAHRPQYSVLLNTKLSPLRNWKEALEAYLTDKQIII